MQNSQTMVATRANTAEAKPDQKIPRAEVVDALGGCISGLVAL
jgi:hypothetical protein